MDLAIQWCTYLIGLPLELLTIAAMLRGGLRRYPFLFAFIIASFLTTIAEMPSSLAFYRNRRNAQAAIDYAWWYWRDEALLTVLVFALVISLIYYATENLATRRFVRLGLILGAVLYGAGSFAIHYNPDPHLSYGLWATQCTRDLKVCATILDLSLWGMLIAARKKDRRLLTLSCALGIMFAGEAIGESVRNLATPSQTHLIADAGGIITIASDLAFFYMVWRLFRVPGPPARQQNGAAADSGSRP